MAFTTAELDALKAAYAAGALTVSYEGKTITYGNAADLLSRIRTIEGEISATAGSPRPMGAYVSHRRG
jgi:hypothetical protein